MRAIFRRRARAVAIFLPAFLLLLLSVGASSAIHPDQDVLTDRQTEDLREHANDPPAKLKLFVDYIELRTARIHRLALDRSVPGRITAIHNSYEEFADLCDELADNMDAYDEQHEDLRKELKQILEASARWIPILKEPEANEDYDFVRKAAIDAGQGVGESAGQMIAEQTKYFTAHKKDQNAGGN
jgi:hypothetical protein